MRRTYNIHIFLLSSSPFGAHNIHIFSLSSSPFGAYNIFLPTLSLMPPKSKQQYIHILSPPHMGVLLLIPLYLQMQIAIYSQSIEHIQSTPHIGVLLNYMCEPNLSPSPKHIFPPKGEWCFTPISQNT